ncbi:MAG: tRNA dihydrouridine synthase DusB [Candidatus Omnitrophota bacterium]
MEQIKKDPIAQMIEARAVLAPMSGITDIPFRLLARKFGCKFAFTEMIDVNGIVYKNRKSFRLLERVEGDAPLGVQLVGQDADKMVSVARICEEKGFEILDLNAGCPARKVVSCGKGSALMKEPGKLAGMVRRLVKELTIPVTVKIRSGWDEDNLNYMEVAGMLEEEGASAICIHTRTKEQMYKGAPSHNIVREIKERIKIPVFASGNIFSVNDIAGVIDETKCDGVFVARGALARPWIFREANAFFSGGQTGPGGGLPKDPDLDELKGIIADHFALCRRFYNDSMTFKRMYKHIVWYLKKFKNINSIMIDYKKAYDQASFENFLTRLRLDEKNRLFMEKSG